VRNLLTILWFASVIPSPNASIFEMIFFTCAWDFFTFSRILISLFLTRLSCKASYRLIL
jgi:hypothetical protein